MTPQELRAALVAKALEQGDAAMLKAAVEISDTYLKSALKLVEEVNDNG